MDYIITYNLLFFRYDNSNNKENNGEKMNYTEIILSLFYLIFGVAVSGFILGSFYYLVKLVEKRRKNEKF